MDRQMEIEEILANIEEILEQAKSVPFSDKAMVDRDELFDLITDIRLKLPTEIAVDGMLCVKEKRYRTTKFSFFELAEGGE